MFKEIFRKTVLITFLLLLLFLPAKAFSGNQAGSFNVTPFIGEYEFDSDQQLDDDIVFGIGLGYNYTERLGVEAVFDYLSTNYNNSVNDTQVNIFHLDGLYHFMPDKQLVPYVVAGLGIIDINKLGRDAHGQINYGGGIKYFITKAFAIRGDIRQFFDFDAPNNNLAYTVGLAYNLGKQSMDAEPMDMDSDGDGVYDKSDECPDTPRAASVDMSGCPMDSDGDGVFDHMDKCPDTPRGASVNSDGCPLDSDGDGVFDHMDKCPGTPDGIKVDNVGCPVPIKERVSIDLNVEFQTDSATVRNAYHDPIQEVANFMKAYPGTNAEIEGHTDSVGQEKANLVLSQKRAEAVVSHLIDFGISPSRLKAVGYGESKPAADNSTKEGQKRNRRVVAVISTIITKYK